MTLNHIARRSTAACAVGQGRTAVLGTLPFRAAHDRQVFVGPERGSDWRVDRGGDPVDSDDFVEQWHSPTCPWRP